MYTVKYFIRLFKLLIPIGSKRVTENQVKNILKTNNELKAFIHTAGNPKTIIWGKFKRMRIIKVQ